MKVLRLAQGVTSRWLTKGINLFYLARTVWFVASPSLGAKNGKSVGMKSNIAAIAVVSKKELKAL
jgi:hypothetical protein